MLAGGAWGLRAAASDGVVHGWLTFAVSRWPLTSVLDRWARPASTPREITGVSGAEPTQPAQPAESSRSRLTAEPADLATPDTGERTALEDTAPVATEAAEDGPPEAPRLPITRLAVPHLRLAADVLPAPIVTVSGGTTWDVPSFAVGHGENSAGAGQPGNAVLLGHVTSPNAGSVFKDLYRMQVGDPVLVFSGEQEFDYAVTEVRTVPRSDLSMLTPTESATVTLITCAGTWLPALQDFSHRLAVRAELVTGPTAR